MLYEKFDRDNKSNTTNPSSRHNRPKREMIKAVGEIRQSGTEFRKVRFVDLSEAGFRIYYPSPLRLDELLRVKFPGIGALNAEIRWCDRSYYGCSFENPLYPSIWEHLVRQNTKS